MFLLVEKSIPKKIVCFSVFVGGLFLHAVPLKLFQDSFKHFKVIQIMYLVNASGIR
jgi:hypothetical protein